MSGWLEGPATVSAGRVSNQAFLSPDVTSADTVIKSGYTIQMTATAFPGAPGSCNGVAAGCTAGFLGGRVDDALMRVTDVFLAFPPLLFLILITGLLGSSLPNIVIALGVIVVAVGGTVTFTGAHGILEYTNLAGLAVMFAGFLLA